MDGSRIAQMLNDARSHADSGDMLIASQLYANAAELEPLSAAAWYGLGVVQTTRGMPGEAIIAFEKSLEINSKHAPTMANLAVLLESSDPSRASTLARAAMEQLGKIQQLVEIAENFEVIENNISVEEAEDEELILLESREVITAETILDSRPVQSMEDVIEEAKKLIQQDKAMDALNLVRKRIDEDGSQSFELWAICSTCLSIVGHTNEALESLEYAIALGDDRAKTHFNHSQILRKLGRDNDAMKSLSNALLADPEHVNSLVSMGDMRNDIGNTDEAISFWERSLQIQYDAAIEHRINEARLVASSGNEEEAIEDPIVNTVANKISMAKELTESGDHVNSVKVWKALLEDNKNDPMIWNGMADSLSAAGHIDRALQCRQKAKSLEDSDKESEDIEIEPADLIAAGNEAKEMLERQDEVPKLDPNISIEWYNKGVNLLAEERSAEALSAFEKAIGGAPREELELRVKAQAGRGHALYQMGKFGDSIRSYHTAISMNPEAVGGKLLYNMGSSYASLELFADAVKCFIQALDRGLDQHDRDLCRKQLSRCKILAKEQSKRSN